MTLPSGQPVLDAWQKGVPQSMQREACSWISLSVSGTSTERKSLQPLRDRAVAHVLAGLVEEFAFSCHG